MKKKLAALALALMMVLSLMAVPAMAYGEDGHVHTAESGIQPHGPVMDCPQCGGNAYPVTVPIGNGQTMTYYACSCGWTSQVV